MKLTKIWILLIIIIATLVTSGCSRSNSNETEEIYVFAASSLTDSLEEIVAQFEAENEDAPKVNLVFGSSGKLQKQIENGAPCDIFISASEDSMDTLEQKGLIEPNTRKNLLFNDLVLISKKGTETSSDNLEEMMIDSEKYIAIGEPTTVPAGQYAKQSLENANLWSEVENQLVYANNVRQILTYVINGDVDYGIVYLTDAMLEEEQLNIYEIPSELHDEIVYPIAMIENSKNSEAAIEFYEYLCSDEAKEIFEKYGFQTK